MGLMNMIGITPSKTVDIDAAVAHLVRSGEDSRAMNALGVIYYRAPDIFEDDPVKLVGFKTTRRNKSKAIELFRKAEEKGSM